MSSMKKKLTQPIEKDSQGGEKEEPVRDLKQGETRDDLLKNFKKANLQFDLASERID